MSGQWKDRQGNRVPGEDTQDKTLSFLYNNPLGKCLTHVMIRPWVSKTAGKLMDSRLSATAIPSFIKSNRIDMNCYEDREFTSFNDFFTRQVKEGMRPVDMKPSHLISPCDCKLSVYPITDDLKVKVKGTVYTMESLLRDNTLAQRFQGGTFLLFRLTKDDYHRYCYIDSGTKTCNVRIPGVYYTVNPIAMSNFPVYKENTREYTLLETENFGTVLMMEVGATMVGRIVNYHAEAQVTRGQEKGRFEFGGSTIIACLEKDAAIIDPDIWKNTENGDETIVHMGEKIGITAK